jgi:hypothetical protein
MGGNTFDPETYTKPLEDSSGASTGQQTEDVQKGEGPAYPESDEGESDEATEDDEEEGERGDKDRIPNDENPEDDPEDEEEDY